mgnify:CR=1 FL=1|tara:strand:- start:18 stop:263 length:246 start_codon:yes stop_codon:yes gene_type:complete
MGEAKRRKTLGIPPRQIVPKKEIDDSPRIINWLPFTENQKDNFIKLSIRVGWLGIALLILLWIVVRFIGPAAGWWIPADNI